MIDQLDRRAAALEAGRTKVGLHSCNNGAMNTKQTILDRELFVQAVRHMSEDDLLYLNRMVVERLKLLTQARSTVEFAQFAQGDRVSFTADDGSVKNGMIIRLNKEAVTLLTGDGHLWKIPPGFLRKKG